ncbi:hypothetical protein IV203_013309 [Nitzschia inconspicua]|uniref:Uncharacterized protein n=1 Tax=Nitzschia inconspicua TaxID=303405 RepID=A0A9K3M5H1_9STRA|nr:hypothetical protein IV203_013309 [Nitzschia inconspicua]
MHAPAGYHYLSETNDNPAIPAREVMCSATEAELAGTLHNCKKAYSIRVCLEELGYPQGPTPITDNSIAVGIANDIVKQKRCLL